MWSDTLRAAERLSALMLMLWGGASVIAATSVWVWLTVGRRRSDLLRGFAIQTVGWGIVALALGGVWLTQLRERDLAGAIRLDRTLWFAAGLALGIAAAGLILTIAGSRPERHWPRVGAGMGMTMQGIGLLVLALRALAITGSGP